MTEFVVGDTVALKAHFEDGAFPDEYLVTFPTVDGDVSGFVKHGNAVAKIDDKPYLAGRVEENHGSYLILFVRGSFFTNSGFVKIRPEQIERVFA